MKIRRLVPPFLTVLFLTIATAAPADVFKDFAALAKSADYLVGRDYDVYFQDRGSQFVALAIHGGNIEPGTTELAHDVADPMGWSTYELDGHIQSGDKLDGDRKTVFDLHITSSHFDEPRAVALVKKARRCVTFHGFTDSPELDPSDPDYFPQVAACVGGTDATMRAAMIAAIEADPVLQDIVAIDAVDDPTKGDTVTDRCWGLRGGTNKNIVNRCGEKPDGSTLGGMQLEMSRSMRRLLTDDPVVRKAFIAAVRKVMKG